jgi:uncharacterized protein YjbI with pentapeptide repeats
LSGADLSGAFLPIGAGLRETPILSMAVILMKADLSWTNLRNATLSKAADVSWANLSEADLSDAHLTDTNLSAANLRGANLRGAILMAADLSGADLRDARSLTQEQINMAFGDENTKLPDHLQHPTHWR